MVEVERMLDRPVFAPREEANRVLRVAIEHTAEPNGYAAHMALFSASGEPLGAREIAIEAQACAEATEAFTLALSIMADLAQSLDEPSPPPLTRSKDTPPSPGPIALPHVPARSAPWKLQLAAGPAVVVETSPTVAPGGHLFAVVEPPRLWPVMLGALSSLRPHSAREDKQFWLSSTRIDAALCLPRQHARRFSILGCLGPQMTVHAAWGSGFGADRSGLSATFGGVVQGYASYALTRNLHRSPRSLSRGHRSESRSPSRTERGRSETAFETSTVSATMSIGTIEGFGILEILGKP